MYDFDEGEVSHIPAKTYWVYGTPVPKGCAGLSVLHYIAQRKNIETTLSN